MKIPELVQQNKTHSEYFSIPFKTICLQEYYSLLFKMFSLVGQGGGETVWVRKTLEGVLVHGKHVIISVGKKA